MPVFKDEKTNKWYAMVRFTDWQGQRKQKCKRGFATRRDALEWEKVFQMQTTSDLDMSFEAFVELYKAERQPRCHQLKMTSGCRPAFCADFGQIPAGSAKLGLFIFDFLCYTDWRIF